MLLELLKEKEIVLSIVLNYYYLINVMSIYTILSTVSPIRLTVPFGSVVVIWDRV